MWLALPVMSLTAAFACGPYFPHTLLGSGRGAMLTGPYADFGLELSRIEVDVPTGVVGNAMKRDDAEKIDALRELGADHPSLTALEQFRSDLERSKWSRSSVADVPEVPDGLPDAWRLYLEAVRLQTLGQYADARERFLRVYSMPTEQSGSRGLWAGHNLSVWSRDPAVIAEVRARVVAGEPDTLGVTGAAVGWLARDAWYEGRGVSAIHGYLAQHHTGDPTAEQSLRWLFKQVMADPDQLQSIAQDPKAATALTAWMVSGGGTAQQRAEWLNVASPNIVSPGLLAWVAWLNRDLPRLSSLLDAAEPSGMTRWLGARQAMVQGDLDSALSLLDQASFPDAEPWRCAWYSRGSYDRLSELHPGDEVASERGVLLLRSGDSVGALRAFAEAGHWFDTAHVAERVVSLDALKAAVDVDLLPLLPEDQRDPMKALLARRLFRSGDPATAEAYFPAELAQKTLRYSALVEEGTAPALWEAARLMREDGIDLTGTELGPDFAWAGGMFPPPDLRTRAPVEEPHGLTAAQSRLIETSAPDPNERFHYRYQAAELAWQAAARIPEGHPDAPRILCQAGLWLKLEDPKAADRFYKEMVWRGWGTPLGETADALRWFPTAEQCALDGVTVDEAPPSFIERWLDDLWDALSGG